MSIKFEVRETSKKEYNISFLQGIEGIEKHAKFIRGFQCKITMRSPEIEEQSPDITVVRDRDNSKVYLTLSTKHLRMIRFETPKGTFKYRLESTFARELIDYFRREKEMQDETGEYKLDNFYLSSLKLAKNTENNNNNNDNSKNINKSLNKLESLYKEILTIKQQSLTRKKDRNYVRNYYNDPKPINQTRRRYRFR